MLISLVHSPNDVIYEAVNIMSSLIQLTSTSSAIIPGNVEFLASFIHEETDIEDRAIIFFPNLAMFKRFANPHITKRTNPTFDVLMTVPIASTGELSTNATIEIIAGFDASLISSSFAIGIFDGINANAFIVADRTSFMADAPCYPLFGTGEDTLLADASTPEADEVTFHFTPFHSYGTCYTAQEGGYANVATFDTQLDPTMDLNLLVEGNSFLRFHYFIVNILD